MRLMKSLVMKTTLKFALALTGLVMLSNVAYSQDPGGSPDGPPPAVPIEDHMNLILAVIGVVFALFIVWRMQNKHITKKA